MADIIVNGNELKLSSQQVEDECHSVNARNSNFIYIQGVELLTNAEKGVLQDFDVEILEYISEKTYLCRYKHDNLDQIRKLNFIRIANVYSPALKTALELKDAIKIEDEGNFTVDLLMHEGCTNTPQQLATVLLERGIVTNEGNVKAYPQSNKVRVTVPGSAIESLEKFDDVNRIEEAEVISLANDLARSTVGINFVLNGTEFKGANQIVAVADTGFDRGSKDKEKLHPAFKPDNIKELIAVGRKDSGLTNDPNGHGTHVCGSIVGDGTSTDRRAGGRVQGTAPEASLIVQSLLTDEGKLDTPDDFLPLLSSAYERGARIHSNSWTADWRPRTGQVAYNDWAKSIDKFVFENPEMVILVAAGNHGQKPNAGTQQTGASSAAKNCITVGATVSERPNDGRRFAPWLASPKDPREIAPFTSRGPTKEGRIKPDVMAPGTAILSTASRDVPRYSEARVEYGVCTDDDWMFKSGTSMSTPVVAGCCAALREAVLTKGVSPSAALIKSLLINGTIDLHSATTPTAPNGIQGFGRVQMKQSIVALSDKPGCGFVDAGLGKAVPPLSPSNRVWKSPLIGIDGDKAQNVSEGTHKTFVVTMAYSDREGQLLQNDLNLIVRDANGAEKHGNSSVPGEFDSQNNVEKVIWEGIAFPATVIVEAIGGFTRFNDPQGFAAVWAVL